jgi:hypothetical protein
MCREFSWTRFSCYVHIIHEMRNNPELSVDRQRSKDLSSYLYKYNKLFFSVVAT